MKRFTTSLMAIFAIMTAQAQTVSFEDLTLTSPSTYWSGGPGTVSKDSAWLSGGCTFRNAYGYDTSFGGYSYWSGMGFSKRKDSMDTQYSTNEMACMAAEGQGGSTHYGIAYISYDPMFNTIILPTGSKPQSVYINNTTIAYRSMQNGDGVAKKFGGSTGKDADYFRLDITGWSNGLAKTDTVKFYLADFRDTNSANDYIVKDWRMVNLSSLGTCDSLTYNLVSTDTNSGGILTPAYFCLDNLTFTPLATNDVASQNDVRVYPNPFENSFAIENKSSIKMSYTIMSINGQTMSTGMLPANTNTMIQAAHYPAGNYFISLQEGNTSRLIKLIK